MLTYFPQNDVIQKTTTLSFIAWIRWKVHGQCQSSPITTENLNTRNAVNIIEFYIKSVWVIHWVNVSDRQLLLNDESRNSLEMTFLCFHCFGLNIGGYKILYPPVQTLWGPSPCPPVVYAPVDNVVGWGFYPARSDMASFRSCYSCNPLLGGMRHGAWRWLDSSNII